MRLFFLDEPTFWFRYFTTMRIMFVRCLHVPRHHLVWRAPLAATSWGRGCACIGPGCTFQGAVQRGLVVNRAKHNGAKYRAIDPQMILNSEPRRDGRRHCSPQCPDACNWYSGLGYSGNLRLFIRKPLLCVTVRSFAEEEIWHMATCSC